MMPVRVYICGLFSVCCLGGCQSHSGNLARQFRSDNPSERAAACVKAARLEDKAVLALLVERLEDVSEEVRLCAIQSLQRLTGQSLGYKHYQRRQQRQEAVARWRDWLRQRAASEPALNNPGASGPA
jgi:hypothetical protein